MVSEVRFDTQWGSRIKISLLLTIAVILGIVLVFNAGIGSAQSVNGTNASISLENQTTNGQTVTVEKATLPEDGFIVIHGDTYIEGIGRPRPLAVSDHLTAGIHRNLTISVSNGVPGGTANATNFTGGRYVARMYPDTNGNDVFDYYLNQSVDSPYDTSLAQRYIAESNPFIDIANVHAKGSYAARVAAGNVTQPAIDFSGRTTGKDSRTVIVDSVTLPNGGFVTVYNDSYLPPENATVGAVIGSSKYLDKGTHQNVKVKLYDVSGLGDVSDAVLRDGQRLVVSPVYDSDGDQTYDFVSTEGSDDVPYTRSGSRVVAVGRVSIEPGMSQNADGPTQVSDATSRSNGSEPASGNSNQSGGSGSAGGNGSQSDDSGSINDNSSQPSGSGLVNNNNSQSGDSGSADGNGSQSDNSRSINISDDQTGASGATSTTNTSSAASSGEQSGLIPTILNNIILYLIVVGTVGVVVVGLFYYRQGGRNPGQDRGT